MLRPALGVTLLAVIACADAATLYLSHPYGELVDRGEVTAWFSAADGRLGCNPRVKAVRSGREITIAALRLPVGAPLELCAERPSAVLGEFEAGWWTAILELYESDGSTLTEQTRTEFRVRTPGMSCNRDVWLGSQLIVLHRSLQGSEIVNRIATDPAFAARLGSPLSGNPMRIGSYEYAVLAYPILENPNAKRELLERTGEYVSVEVNRAFCYSPPPGDWMGIVREFHHAELDHYFYTANAAEIAGLDAGTGARGWVRTGKSFDVLVAPGCPPARHEQAAYRFFGKPGVGPSSHVFTVDREECFVVDRGGQWLYEGSPFWATPPDSMGACSYAGEIPLYRVWKPFGESNHRFTTERAVVEEMTAKGWVDEGVAMCVRRP